MRIRRKQSMKNRESQTKRARRADDIINSTIENDFISQPLHYISSTGKFIDIIQSSLSQ